MTRMNTGDYTRREAALELIKNNPGISAFEIRGRIGNAQGISTTVFSQNLKRLYKAARVDRQPLISSIRGGNSFTYTESKPMTFNERILEIIKRTPGVKLKDITMLSGDAGIDEQRTASTLAELHNEGLVVRTKTTKGGRLSYTYWASGDKDAPIPPPKNTTVIDPPEAMFIANKPAVVMVDRFNLGLDMAAQICEAVAGRPGVNPFEAEVARDMARRIRKNID